ncbi:hybrid sensor histidine kinase/response regulator [Sinomicrobium weinanense]|uniref:histidine kinase n=1 Tax=Sinomicrobium weinanense TaxID=2842200 RepID=A0A926Q226_9FLAO|nr:ATP-binding protein [Sinomicrobium weinanense]MBC9795399.1 response regulator [Sinomicrobium weinanense]MBU3123924.1 response regulator [Sinomicrobium weinanense]
MSTKKSTITYKVLLSYIALALLMIAVGWFVYAEFQIFTKNQNTNTAESQKLLITSSLIAHLYETESLARITLQSSSTKDFNTFMDETAQLYTEIDELKPLIDREDQVGLLHLLDSVKLLLDKKVNNIKELRTLKRRDETDVSLEKAIEEITQIESSVGELTLEQSFTNPEQFGEEEREKAQEWVNFINKTIKDNTSPADREKMADSVLTASKELLKDLKLKSLKIKRSLTAKEDELLRNDIIISQQLREILSSFESEIINTTNILNRQRDVALKNTVRVITIAAVIGLLLAIFFSYLILNDFWKSQSYRKQLEKAKNTTEQLLKTREQLIYTVGHDLRTPLSTIIGYTDLLHNTEINPKQGQYVTRVKNASEYVSNLVDDLLDYNKLEAGKIKIEHTLFSLENIITDTAESTRELYHAKPVELIIDIDERLKQHLTGDPFRIKQILTNLIGNAYKFTEKGHIKIKAGVLEKYGTTYRVRIDVEDTGIGIQKDKQEIIFNEFTQAESAIEKKYGGTGLGLTISKKLASLLNGTLELKSREGKGSTFTLKIPLQIPAEDTKKEIAPQVETVLQKPRKIVNAVLIDDDESVLSLTSEVLRQQSFRVNAFARASEALEHIRNNDFDIILTDIQMPEMDGFRLLEAIADRNEKPVIAITGRADLNTEEYIRAGFAAVIQKPFAPGALVELIVQVLSSDTSPNAENLKNTMTMPSENSTNDSLYNLDTLKELLQNDEDALKEILQTFVESTGKNMEDLNLQFENRDIEGVKHTAHKMLSMFKQIKAWNIVELLEWLEHYEPDTSETPEAHAEKLRKRVPLVLKALEEEMGVS